MYYIYIIYIYNGKANSTQEGYIVYFIILTVRQSLFSYIYIYFFFFLTRSALYISWPWVSKGKHLRLKITCH